MRGTPHDVFVGECHIGIIPAYAGNTFRPVMVGVRPRDHPRVCGEHALLANANAEPLGSSPRMRGTQSSSAKSDYRRGIIPAYAGNTAHSVVSRHSTQDHPRVCGEHRVRGADHRRGKGSSPRMRGTPQLHAVQHGTERIIPAYARNTSSFTRTVAPTGDHPRVCGEHLFGGTFDFCHMGSSPRMRGTRQDR